MYSYKFTITILKQILQQNLEKVLLELINYFFVNFETIFVIYNDFSV